MQSMRKDKHELEEACRDLDAEMKRKDELMVQVATHSSLAQNSQGLGQERIELHRGVADD